MRLDHLLSKEEEVGVAMLFSCGGREPFAERPEDGSGSVSGGREKISGGDAPGGDTRGT